MSVDQGRLGSLLDDPLATAVDSSAVVDRTIVVAKPGVDIDITRPMNKESEGELPQDDSTSETAAIEPPPDESSTSRTVVSQDKADSNLMTQPAESPGSGSGQQHAPAGPPDATVGVEPSAESSHDEWLQALAQANHDSGTRYDLIESFAKGGIGEIWLAQDDSINRHVAYKVLLPAAKKNRRTLERFFEEAQITGQLEHPGVIPIYDLGVREDGTPYYAMKLIRGKTLDRVINECHELPTNGSEYRKALTKLLRCLIDVCNTIAYAHDHGVLHRDLKPQNVMLGPFGETIVLDWGLAKLFADETLAPEPAESGLTSSTGVSTGDSGGSGDSSSFEQTIDTRSDEQRKELQSLSGHGHSKTEWMSAPSVVKRSVSTKSRSMGTETLAGSILGTPAYMPPEQAAGRLDEIDTKSDIYALGAMLYRILTGRVPVSQRSTRAVLKEIISGKLKPPRAHNPSVPRVLEAICLKALSKKKADRYDTALSMAADLEAYLADEPVSAYPEPWWTRLRRWTRRHRTIVTTAAAVVVMSVSVWIGINRLEARNRLNAQVDRLRHATPVSIPLIVESLEPSRSTALSRVAHVLTDPSLEFAERIRLRMAQRLLSPPESPSYDESADALGHALFQADLSEFAQIVTVLKSDADRFKSSLWTMATDTAADRFDRFRAACVLAQFDANAGTWDNITGDVVGRLLLQPPLAVPVWNSVLRPVRDQLLPELRQHFTSANRPETRLAAAFVLSDLFADRLPVLIELVSKAEPTQLNVLLPSLGMHKEKAVAELTLVLTATDLRNTPRDEADALANKMANAAIALLGLHQPDPVWPVLGPNQDQRVRSLIVDRLGRLGIDPKDIIAKIRPETDPIVLVACLLALGEYDVGSFFVSERNGLMPTLETLLREHPHPGVHSATEWLLKKWGHADTVQAVANQSRRSPAETPRSWTVTGQGHTMAVISGPVEFWMGSAKDEPHRVESVGLKQVDVEMRHRRRIPRSFAISTTEVTVEQFLRFRPNHPIDHQYAPTPDSPIIQVSWLDAIQYCRWLSDQEGIPETQKCFPPVDQINPTLKVTNDVLKKTGYRLPTAAEWEYAARAGTVTARCFGDSAEMLPRYAWYFNNSANHAWAVGELRPNDFGLFDVHGNVMEWCHNWYFDDPTDGGKLLIDGVVTDGTETRDGMYREIRGGSYRSRSELIRIADRDHEIPLVQGFEVGFRIARTIPSDTDSRQADRKAR